MKNKPLTLLFTCLLLTVILFSAALPVGAQTVDATQDSAAPQSYINKETGYKALVIDEDLLLTEQERIDLIEDTKQIADSAEPREHACSEVNVTHLATDKKYGALLILLQAVLHIIFTSGGGGGRSSGSSGCSSGCSSGSSGCGGGGGGCGSGGSSSF